MSDVQLHWPNPTHIPYVWHEVRPILERVAVRSAGEYTTTDLLTELLSRRQVLLIGIKNNEVLMAATFMIVDYPRKRVFRVITWATKSGDGFDFWMQPNLFQTVENYAREHECYTLEAWTRKGLARKLDWDHEYCVVQKNI
tara:strand:+ start:277 stop:699 length:423 start_codon:yes stop_codon:yes gene_type:complete